MKNIEWYRQSLSQIKGKSTQIPKIGLGTAAAMAAAITMPVDLVSQVVCGNQGTPTRTVGPCVGYLGNYYSDSYCALFDFDGDGTDEIQIRYYNGSGYPAYMYIERLTGNTLGMLYMGDYAASYGQTFPASPDTIYEFMSNQILVLGVIDRLFAVPLSGGNGFGFITVDRQLYSIADGTHQATHPITNQPICCTTYSGITMWGAQSGITSYDGIILNDAGYETCPEQILPVELVSFTAKATDDKVMLEWTTETEVNNSGFAIERSTDGKDFREIAFVDGQGESKHTIDYTYEDKSIEEGVTYYYRLRQIDYDGGTELSDMKHVVTQSSKSTLTFGPNPVSDVLEVQLNAKSSGNATIDIINISGEVLISKQFVQEQGINSYNVDLSTLGNDVVFLKVNDGTSTFYKKIIIIR